MVFSLGGDEGEVKVARKQKVVGEHGPGHEQHELVLLQTESWRQASQMTTKPATGHHLISCSHRPDGPTASLIRLP